MFRLRAVRHVQFSAANRRNFSSLNKTNGKPVEKITTSSTGKPTTPGAPVPPSKSSMIIASTIITILATGSITMILGANDKDSIARINKHAPFLNPYLDPFRAPENKSTKAGAPKPVKNVTEKEAVAVLPVVEEKKHQHEAEVAKPHAVTTPETTAEVAEPPHVADKTQPEVVKEDSEHKTTPAEFVDAIEAAEVFMGVTSDEHHFQETEQGSEHRFTAAEVQALEEVVHDIQESVAAREAEENAKHEKVDEQHVSSNGQSQAHHEKSDATIHQNSLMHYELQNQARQILTELQQDLHRQHEKHLEEKYRRELQAALDAQAAELNKQRDQAVAEVHAKLSGALEQEVNYHTAVMKQAHSEELLALQPAVAQLKADIAAFDQVAKETAYAIQQTLDTHRISSTVLALELALSGPSGQPMTGYFTALKAACAGDQLVSSVLEALPKSVLARGALNHSELQVRFNIMRGEVRKVALAPEAAPSMLGQMIGTVLAKMTLAPKGFVTGAGVEDVLARADYYLERGRVREALDELEQVDGYASVLMSDFKQLATDRLVLDQTLAVLKAKSVLRHTAFTK